MKKVKTFLHVFINSLFPYETYYHKLLKTRFSFSLKYFITLVIALHVLAAAVFFAKNVVFNPDIPILKDNLMKMLNQYPQDLIITIKNKTLTTNWDRPYIVWFDYKGVPYPLVAIDPNAAPEQIHQYDVFILLNSAGATSINPKTNVLKTYPFTAVDNYVINKANINRLQEIFIDSVALRFPLMILAGYIIINIFLSLAFLAGKLIYLAAFALLVFGAVHYLTKHKKIAYAKILQITLHASTLPLIFEYIVITTRLRFSVAHGGLVLGPLVSLFWLFSVVYAAFLIAGAYEALNHHAHPTHHRAVKKTHHLSPA